MGTARRALEITREEGVRTLLRKARVHGPDIVGATMSSGVQGVNKLRYRTRDDYVRVMAEDWDDLIILDACRYDQFERLNGLSGDLESRISLGSATPEFLSRNFAGETHHDTVYVTGNPMYRHVGLDDTFHATRDVWRTDWDEETRTVRPEPMVEATLAARETYPKKRIISHFMQPHYPFIGPKGREITHSGAEWTKRLVEDGEGSRDDPTVWNLAATGEIDDETARAAYDENLDVVMPHVRSLLESTDGRTVVTSDHGNLTGERIAPLDGRRYGHPWGTYVDELREVPWLVVAGTERRRVVAEPPTDGAEVDRSTVRDRLSDLGYVDL